MFEDMTYSTFNSRYTDQQYIGSGGFAKVFKVFDQVQNHYVALKIADVRPEWKQFTLQREVELVNKLEHHKNIARYDACYRFNTGITGEMDFAILKFYEHGNLEQFLSREELSHHDVRIVVHGILSGLAFIHRNGIIHRDMKSQNILLHREDGVWIPKITDFGLSRYLNVDKTTTNSSIGLSFAFAAPEQIRNQKIYKNVDLWALGVIIYRILAGELPFKSIQQGDERSLQSQLELSNKIINLDLPNELDTLKEPYRTIIKRCLVVDPQERAQSAEELIALLNGTDTYPKTSLQSDNTVLFSEPDKEIHKEPSIEQRQENYEAYLGVSNYLSPPDYELVQQNKTVILGQEKPASPEIPKPDLKTGEPKSRTRWIILVAIVLLAIIGWNVVVLMRRQAPTKPLQEAEPKTIPAGKPTIKGVKPEKQPLNNEIDTSGKYNETVQQPK